MRMFMLECDDCWCSNEFGGEMEINDAGDIKIDGKFRAECPRYKLAPTNIHEGYGYFIVCEECGCEVMPMEEEHI